MLHNWAELAKQLGDLWQVKIYHVQKDEETGCLMNAMAAASPASLLSIFSQVR